MSRRRTRCRIEQLEKKELEKKLDEVKAASTLNDVEWASTTISTLYVIDENDGLVPWIKKDGTVTRITKKRYDYFASGRVGRPKKSG